MWIDYNSLGKIGIVRDVPGYKLARGAWSDGRNIRFCDDSVERCSGEKQVMGTLSGPPVSLFYTELPAENLFIYANQTDVFATDGTTHKEISKAATTYTGGIGLGWNGGMLGGILVLNNNADVPQVWNPVDFGTPQLLVDLTGWDPKTAGARCRVLRPFKQNLIALNITESASEFPNMVWWSHPVAPGSVTGATDWDFSLATNLAGRRELSQGGLTAGVLKDGLGLGDVFFIYAEKAVWAMQNVGGQSIWRTWPRFENIGILDTDCVVSIPGHHALLTLEGDLVIHNGVTFQSVGDERYKKWIRKTIDSDYYDRVFLAHDSLEREVWVCMPEAGQDRCTQAAIWNYEDNTWGSRDLPDVLCATRGVVTNTDSDVWDSPPGNDLAWNDEDILTWDERLFNPMNQALFMGSYHNQRILQMDTGVLADPTTKDFTAWIERTGIAEKGVDRAGRPIRNPNNFGLLRAIRPIVDGGYPINVYGGAAESAEGPYQWEGPISFDPATDDEVTPLVSGKYFGVRFEFPDGLMKLNGYSLDVEDLGAY